MIMSNRGGSAGRARRGAVVLRLRSCQVLILLLTVVCAIWAPGNAHALNPIYRYTVVAEDAMTTSDGYTISEIEPDVSVNENGRVAFVARVGTGDQLMAGRDPASVINVSRSPDDRNFSSPQINNQDFVVTRELSAGHSIIRVWDARTPGSFDIILSTTLSHFTQATSPTLGNYADRTSPKVAAYLGREHDLPFNFYINPDGRRDNFETVSNLSGDTLTRFRSMSAAADNNTFVLQYTDRNDVSRIVAAESEMPLVWDETLIAATAPAGPWLELGLAPGISDAGSAIAFYGHHQVSGPGIYFALAGPFFKNGFGLWSVVSTNSLIALDDEAEPIRFYSFDPDNRVGVLHQAGSSTFLHDAYTIVFGGTPERASRDTPVPGVDRPFLFSAQEGIWTVRSETRPQLDAAGTYLHHATPLPVIQLGDEIGGEVVEQLTLYDPIALPRVNLDGAPYGAKRGDHFVALAARTAAGVKVVRADRIDDDQDGLMDHWETEGIDVDHDGFIELDLPAMGADARRQDIFLEVDWTSPRTQGGYKPWSNRLPPNTAQRMAEMFAQAPVVNPNGSTGITLHVDAGTEGWYAEDLLVGSSDFGYMTWIPLSFNMPDDSALLDGGDEVVPWDAPYSRFDMIHWGKPYTFTMEGMQFASLHEVKDRYFGQQDQWAREWAFRYCMISDSQRFVWNFLPGTGAEPVLANVVGATSNTLTTGTSLEYAQNPGGNDSILITTGTGAGQLRVIDDVLGSTLYLRRTWETLPDPTSRFTLLETSIGGRGEVNFLRHPPDDFNAWAGNDFMLSPTRYGVNDGGWLAAVGPLWRTMNHEMGHTFGLRHGGNNHVNNKAAYLSIMNYRYLRSGFTDFDGNPLVFFDDWGYLQMEPQINGLNFGNSFHRAVNPGDPTEPDWPDPPDDPDFEMDLEQPWVAVVQPDEGKVYDVGDDVQVSIVATDNVSVAQVIAVFDRDGDGVIEDGNAERVAATPVGNDVYVASFLDLSGPFTVRGVMGIGFDTSDNIGAAVIPVVAGDPAGAGFIIHESNGVFAQQLPAGARQETSVGPIDVPGTGRLTFTVTATPPVRQASGTGTRHDAGVERIELASTESTLAAAPNPPGLDPSIRTAYWQSPTGGAMTVYVNGPAVYDEEGVFQGHPEQTYALVVTFEPVDITPPQVSIVQPGPDDFVEVGEALTVEVTATDDYTVAEVEIRFDVDGDGVVSGSVETVTATPVGGDVYQAVFAATAGSGGVRSVWADVMDSAGLFTRETGSVEVTEPDTNAPTVSIKSPPAGWPLVQGEDLLVEIIAFDDIELASVIASFDIDGDGATNGPGETTVAAWAGVNLFTAVFPNVTGPNGPRDIMVTSLDTSGNASPASRPVTVGGVEPITETLFTDTGTIPAQPSVWSGGSQQTIDYDPIVLPGSGLLTFIVTDDPSERSRGQNITRTDSYVRYINLDGTDYNLVGTRECNPWDEPVSVCTTTFDAAESGTLDFSILGPGSWNIWGEFSGHLETDYTLDILFTAVDITRPHVAFVYPLLGDNLALGSPVTVQVTVTDAVEVASVVLTLDVNGDRDTDDFGEELSATHVGGGVYEAALSALAGAPGTRTITVLASDTSFNTRERSISVGVGGVGAGETALFTEESIIPAVPIGGVRQVIPYGPITVPGQGRMTFRVTCTPSIRQLGTNIERHDPKVVNIEFNGQPISLAPVGNAWNDDPAVYVSTWDSPGPGTLNFDVLGGGSWNIWGEFQGHYEQDCVVELRFLPGPVVTSVDPGTGSIGGHESVTVHGSGFAYNAMVLFGEIPASEAVWVSATELTCKTPPGVDGSVAVRVLNPDLDAQPWNYGTPYGLFGELDNGFTYEAALQSLATPPGERLLGTYKGYFPAVGSEEPQEQEIHPFTFPGAGRVRFETYAFVPIVNAIPGPYEDPDNLEWHNESTAVRHLTGGDAAGYWTDVTCSDLSFPFGPVRCDATRVLTAAAAGSGEFTVKGPARWNAFWRQFGDFVMVSAPAQHWSLAVWFADQPGLTSVDPTSGSVGGETFVTLSGDYFAEGVAVKFGDRYAADVNVLDPNTLTCKTPSGAEGPVPVEIELLGMTAALPAAYTYLPRVISEFTFSPGGGPPTLRLETESGKIYQLQRCLDLPADPQVWTAIGAVITGDGSLKSFVDPAPPQNESSVFYRIVESTSGLYTPRIISEFTYTPGSGPPTLRIETESGKMYELQRSLDLQAAQAPKTWSSIGGGVVGDGSLQDFTDPAPPEHEISVFYRVVETS